MVGFKFYPPEGSVHYDLLQLAEYNIGVHRGSFLLDPKKMIYKSKKEWRWFITHLYVKYKNVTNGGILRYYYIVSHVGMLNWISLEKCNEFEI